MGDPLKVKGSSKDKPKDHMLRGLAFRSFHARIYVLLLQELTNRGLVDLE